MRPFGIDVGVDLSWLPIAALIAWTLAKDVFPGVTPDLSPAAYWSMAVLATGGLMLSLIAHELAHALVARRFGMTIRTVTLFIFGGVAELEGEPPTARAEFLTAAAGPVASLTLAVLALVAESAAVAGRSPDALAGILWYLAFINAALGLFNLVPAFPLDGGRMLRAALWSWRGDLAAATINAAGGGSLFGILLMVAGVLNLLGGDLVGGMWRFLIGMFLRSAAVGAYRDLLVRSCMEGVGVAAIMSPTALSVPGGLTAAELIADFIYRRHHRSFPVIEDGRLIGGVGVEQVETLPPDRLAGTLVAAIAVPLKADDLVAPDQPALAALKQMQRGGCKKLWVVSHGELCGVLALHDLEEALYARLSLDPRCRRLRSPWSRLSLLR